MNSSFGIWFLSAVVVSGLGFLYTKFNNDYENEIKKQIKIEKLDLEISYRLSQMLQVSHNVVEELTAGQLIMEATKIAKNERLERGYNLLPKLNPLHLTSSPKETTTPSLHPEYAAINLHGLIVNLYHLENDKFKSEIEPVIRQFSDSKFSTTFNPYNRSMDIMKLIKGSCSFAKTVQNVMLERWRVFKFRYLNCSKEQPWCDLSKDKKIDSLAAVMCSIEK